MRRRTVRAIGGLLLLAWLGGLVLADAGEGVWRLKLDEPLQHWLEADEGGVQTVFVCLEGTRSDAPSANARSYGSASHLMWGSETLAGGVDEITQHGNLAPSLSLLRVESDIWEVGLAYIHDLAVIAVECTPAGLEALARMSVVRHVAAADVVMPFPRPDASRRAAGVAPEAMSFASPTELQAAGGATGEELNRAASSLGWYVVSRGAIEGDGEDLPLTLEESSVLPSGTLRVAGWGTPFDVQTEVTLGPNLGGALWREAEELPLTAETLAWLVEGCAQLDAEFAVLAAAEVDGHVFPLYVFLVAQPDRLATGSLRQEAPSVLATRGSHEARVELLWDAVNGSEGYEVLRRDRNEGVYEPLAVVNTPRYTDTDVDLCQQYEYVVRALGGALGSGSAPSLGYVGLVPFPVAAVWSQEETTGGIRVAWEPSPTATYYKLLRTEPMVGTGGPTAKQYTIGVVEEPWFLDVDVVAGQIYQYRVFAYNGCGRAELSPCSTASVLFSPVPSGPSDPPYRIEASRGEPFGRIVLTWTAVPGADGYRVLRADSYLGVYAEVAIVGDRAWEDFDAQMCVDYWYRVQTLHSGGESEPSASAHGIYGYRPDHPREVSASIGTFPDAIRVTWETVEYAKLYNITRAPSAEGPFAVLVAEVEDTMFVDRGLEPGQEFWYKVRASNLCGCSGDSGAVRGATVDP